MFRWLHIPLGSHVSCVRYVTQALTWLGPLAETRPKSEMPQKTLPGLCWSMIRLILDPSLLVALGAQASHSLGQREGVV